MIQDNMLAVILYYINSIQKRGRNYMVKTLAKLAEKTAKSNGAACWVWGAIHQPKMPATLVKKD